MKCPVDATELLLADRSGVEIDYCPKCRGVWLDRGELDKIIDYPVAPRSAPANRQDAYRRDDGHGHDRGRESHGRENHGRNGRRRREGFFGDLFDF